MNYPCWNRYTFLFIAFCPQPRNQCIEAKRSSDDELGERVRRESVEEEIEVKRDSGRLRFVLCKQPWTTLSHICYSLAVTEQAICMNAYTDTVASIPWMAHTAFLCTFLFCAESTCVHRPLSIARIFIFQCIGYFIIVSYSSTCFLPSRYCFNYFWPRTRVKHDHFVVSDPIRLYPSWIYIFVYLSTQILAFRTLQQKVMYWTPEFWMHSHFMALFSFGIFSMIVVQFSHFCNGGGGVRNDSNVIQYIIICIHWMNEMATNIRFQQSFSTLRMQNYFLEEQNPFSCGIFEIWLKTSLS